MNPLEAAFQDGDEQKAVERRLEQLGWTPDCTKVLAFTRHTALVEYQCRRCKAYPHVSFVLIDLPTGEHDVVDEEVPL